MAWAPTRKLFREFHPDGTESIKDWHKAYIEECDPTGYRFAKRMGYSWSEYKSIRKRWPFFANVIEPEWIEDVHTRIQSEALKAIRDKMNEDNAAARFLSRGQYKDTEKLEKKIPKNHDGAQTRNKKTVDIDDDEDWDRVVPFISQGKTQ